MTRFAIKITAIPSSRFGSDAPEVLAEPITFAGFRARTGRRAASLYGSRPEVTFASLTRAPVSWATREAAERNLARLTERGYTAEVVEATR